MARSQARRRILWLSCTGLLLVVWWYVAWHRPAPSAGLEDVLHPEARLYRTLVTVDFDHVPLDEALGALGRQAHCSVLPHLSEREYAGYGPVAGSGGPVQDRVPITAHSAGRMPLDKAIDLLLGSMPTEVMLSSSLSVDDLAAWRENRLIDVIPVEGFCDHAAVTFLYGLPDAWGGREDRDVGKLGAWVEAGFAKTGRAAPRMRVMHDHLLITADPDTQEVVEGLVASFPPPPPEAPQPDGATP